MNYFLDVARTWNYVPGQEWRAYVLGLQWAAYGEYPPTDVRDWESKPEGSDEEAEG